MTKTKNEVLTRDQMRSKIFGAKPKSETVEDFFGCTLELRQPTLQEALKQRDSSEEDKLFFMLTEYAYVPDSGEKVFEPEDIAQIKKLPFGPEFNELMNKINTLLGVNPEEMEEAVASAEKSS
jgi:hypothetical protein